MWFLTFCAYMLTGTVCVYLANKVAYARPSLLCFILAWPIALGVLGLLGLWFLYRDLKYMYVSYKQDPRRQPCAGLKASLRKH